MIPNEKFEHYMSTLDISDSMKDFWKSRFYTVDQKSQEELLVLFDDFPNDIEFFTGLQIKKEEAIKNKDKDTFDKLVLQEAEFIAKAYTDKQ